MTQALQYVEIDIPEFEHNAAAFDGATHLTRGAGLSAAADSKMLTFSCWWKRSAADAATGAGRLISAHNAVGGAGISWHIRMSATTTNNQIRLELLNSAGTEIVDLSSSAVAGPFDEWNHVVLSFDLSETTKRHLYVNDVSDLTVGTYTNDTIDFTKADWGISGEADGTDFYQGSLAHLWFLPGTYIDLSVEANRRKFITADGNPAEMGDDGSGPTGSAPLVYMAGDVSAWHTNKGTGGGFTVTAGALTETVEVDFTYRFTTDTSYLPNDISAIPSIKDVKVTSPIISLGRDLGQRGTVEVTLKDHRHIFNGEAFDSGTFWGKFRARYGLKLRGYDFRLINGRVGDSLDAMETRHYIIESTDGPSTNGEFKIVAKDVLKFLDGDRAQAPTLNSGSLQSDITETTTIITLSPTGIGDEEYSVNSGYANLGGSEVVRWWREQREASNTSATMVYLKMSGADASTAFTDTGLGGTGVTWTAAGNAQLDTADYHIAPSAGLFDGTGDWVTANDSTDFTLGTSDFTVDFWFKRSATGTDWLFGQGNSGPIFPTTASLSIGGGIEVNIPKFFISIGGATLITMTASTLTDTTAWHHYSASRSGSTFRFFIDGVLQDTDTNAGSVTDSGNNFRIGAIGELTTDPYRGWIQHFRLTVGSALHTADFDPEEDYTGNGTDTGDTIVISRAQYLTAAATHESGERFQICTKYLSQGVADIIDDLMETYGGVDGAFIDLTAWQAETATYLNTVYSTLITEPTAVKDLISELIEQAGLVVWFDDINQQIRLQVIRAIPTTAFTYDADNTLADTLEVREQPEKRLSQVYFYFGRLNPLVNLDQIDNYRSSVRVVDTEAETEYGGAAIRRIFSRWIGTGGRTTAETAAENIISRYRDPPRRINFEVLKYSVDAPTLGGGYQIGGWPFQDTDGTAVEVPVQLTRVTPEPDRYAVEGEEMLFAAAAPFSPDNRQIIIDADQNNVNLKTMHDSLFSAASASDTVTCTILAGVTVGSSSVSSPAFDVGTWSPLPTLNLVIEGRIQGHGGNGGAGGQAIFAFTSSGQAGQAGGTALYARQAVALSGSGEVWGGGGGGGGGGGYTDGSSIALGGDGAGGGSGTNSGSGGAGGYGAGDGSGNGSGAAGTSGTSEAGGTGGISGSANGGTGGGPGTAGANGQAGTSSGGSGGAAGRAIDSAGTATGGGSLDTAGSVS